MGFSVVVCSREFKRLLSSTTVRTRYSDFCFLRYPGTLSSGRQESLVVVVVVDYS